MGKSGVLQHKSGNISETRKNRGKVTIGEPIGTHKRSFERYHPRPTTASSSPRLDSHPHPKHQSLLYQERVMLYGLRICPVHSKGPSEQKPIKIFGERGVSRDVRAIYPTQTQI